MNTALKLAAIALALLIPGETLAHGHDRFAKVEIVAQELKPGIYMLTGSGGNIGVSAGEDGVLIIDDQFAPLAEKIQAALNKLAPNKKIAKPKFIINTHYHGDHVGGNTHFGQDGTIMAHDNVYRRLSTDGKTSAAALPVVTWDEGINLYFNDDKLRVMHMGTGHTDGDSVVYWDSGNVVHMGDLFFNGMFPYVDLNAGGSVQSYLDSVNQVIASVDENTQIIPGHGPLASKADLKAFADMIAASIEWADTQKAAGKTLEQMKAEGMPAEFERWNWRFITEEKWIDTLYQ
ncbi:MBL fold metallo-hydrolase [Shewanella submarina]|uniref:beta-lactamase n=1 Tax=Shewanella submarina TaxID=2016376 RepID=A0ABV7GCT0_9GAMM|nr:MBL fold metallo-hydrolase [Shewanella submarina]MCL1038678.1 MBL fold metallo-hydrolase [Shewanella submarina]